MELARKVKTALDESRLLILGTQILFGFQFQLVFQEIFQNAPPDSKSVQRAALLLLVIAVGLLIAPSMHHQIIYGGEDRQGALRTATRCASASLLPMMLALGGSAYVAFAQLFDDAAGVAAAAIFTAVGLSLLYGLGFALRRSRGANMTEEEIDTPLEKKIEQLLTEARVIIPGDQALLGFQFIVVFTKPFSELPALAKSVHAVALGMVALSVVLLLTPAALHRIAYGGEDSRSFLRIASALVVASALPLAVGIAADVYVVFVKEGDGGWRAAAAAALSLLVLLSLWFIYPPLAPRARNEGRGRASFPAAAQIAPSDMGDLTAGRALSAGGCLCDICMTFLERFL
jgi:hypothetical protein